MMNVPLWPTKIERPIRSQKLQNTLLDLVILKSDLKRITDYLKHHSQHTASKALINKMEIGVNILGKLGEI